MILPLFLALLAPELLLVAVPITLANLLSLHTYQSEIQYHYTVYLLAILALAAIHGTARIDREGLTRFLGPSVVVGGILGMLLIGPLPTYQSDNPWYGTASDPAAINDALALIPDNAAVSADWFIGPHIDHRTVVYMYPNPFVRDYWSADAAPGPPVDGAEWVALRADTPGEFAQNTLEALDIIEADPRWEQVVANDTVLLFHRTS